MKKTYDLLGLFLFLATCFSSCSDEQDIINPTVQYIQLSELKKTMSVGDVDQLTATVLPENAIDKTVEWKSSDTNIATIDTYGNIAALAEGKVKISAKANNVTALCDLRIEPVAVDSIILNVSSKKMSEGETFQLTATLLPENATYKEITWLSSDENIATVNQTGIVKAIRKGNVTITAVSSNKTKADSCHVIIVGNDPLISIPKLNLIKNDMATLEVVLPVRLDGKSIEWNSSQESIATVTVDENNSCFAIVKAVGIGSTQIVANIEGGESVTSFVTVQAPKEETSIDEHTVTMNLSLYSGIEEVRNKINELNTKGITIYQLHGNISNLLKVEKGITVDNPFLSTNVEEIDFTGIDGNSWPMVEETILKDGKQININAKGIPDKTFNRGTANAPVNGFNNLKIIRLPEEVQILGYYSFQRSNVTKIFAPGVQYLGKKIFAYVEKLETLVLNSPELIYQDTEAFKGYKVDFTKKCKLYLNPNKKPVDNKYFKQGDSYIEWSTVDTTGNIPD